MASASGEQTWVAVAAADAIPIDSMMAVRVGDFEILLYHLESGEFCATDNICTHEFARLCEGVLDGDLIECPLHAGQFDIRTGKGLCEPIDRDLRVYEVRIESGNLMAKLG